MSERQRTIDRVIAGLQIVAKYKGAMVNGDHDKIYAGAEEDLSDEDRAALLADDWFWCKENECWAKFV